MLRFQVNANFYIFLLCVIYIYILFFKNVKVMKCKHTTVFHADTKNGLHIFIIFNDSKVER